MNPLALAPFDPTLPAIADLARRLDEAELLVSPPLRAADSRDRVVNFVAVDQAEGDRVAFWSSSGFPGHAGLPAASSVRVIRRDLSAFLVRLEGSVLDAPHRDGDDPAAVVEGTARLVRNARSHLLPAIARTLRAEDAQAFARASAVVEAACDLLAPLTPPDCSVHVIAATPWSPASACAFDDMEERIDLPEDAVARALRHLALHPAGILAADADDGIGLTFRPVATTRAGVDDPIEAMRLSRRGAQLLDPA